MPPATIPLTALFPLTILGLDHARIANQKITVSKHARFFEKIADRPIELVSE